MTTFNSLRLFFFGRLGETIGREIELDSSVRSCTVAMLKQQLALRYPQAADDLGSARIRVCIDDVMAEDTSAIGAGTEVAFFPPLSGG